MNLLTTIWSRLQIQFAAYDLPYLYSVVTEADKTGPSTKGFIIQCFNLIDGSTSTYKKNAIIEAMERVAFRHELPKFFNVNNGEDFCFVVDLEEGRDFTGYFLTIRNAEDGVLLSPNNIAGTDEDIQEVNADDLNLAEGSFYKINVLLEHGSGSANGDAATLLADAILIVGKSIDVA
jgi:hypothetical protein